jgi:hypothetical protein
LRRDTAPCLGSTTSTRAASTSARVAIARNDGGLERIVTSSNPLAGLTATRLGLQQLAVHVLARRRHAVTGRFGLRPSPGGIATPAFGDPLEVVRTTGRHLVVERGGDASIEPITTLRRAADLVGVDLDDEFSTGGDTPPLQDPDQPLAVDDEAARRLAGWFAFGVGAIDAVSATSPHVAASATLQLWPEHFDVGGVLALGRPGTPTDTIPDSDRVNVGASPGDEFHDRPYLYVGPWDDRRPGGPSYWNAPFGAVLSSDELTGADGEERRVRAAAFLRHGIGVLAVADPMAR